MIQWTNEPINQSLYELFVQVFNRSFPRNPTCSSYETFAGTVVSNLILMILLKEINYPRLRSLLTATVPVTAIFNCSTNCTYISIFIKMLHQKLCVLDNFYSFWYTFYSHFQHFSTNFLTFSPMNSQRTVFHEYLKKATTIPITDLLARARTYLLALLFCK